MAKTKVKVSEKREKNGKASVTTNTLVESIIKDGVLSPESREVDPGVIQ